MSELLWETFNSDDTLLPLYLPCIIWVSAFAYSRYHGADFSKWVLVHNTHNVGAMLLGSLSLKEWINERIPIGFSLGYFTIDCIDCLLRHDYVYLMHGASCLGMGCACYNVPLMINLRMNSKASFCEISTPFMHLAKKTRNPLHFVLFAVAFTFCRIIWLPVMYTQLGNYLSWKHPIQITMVAFYCLNGFWYIKILRILWTGGKKPDTKKEE